MGYVHIHVHMCIYPWCSKYSEWPYCVRCVVVCEHVCVVCGVCEHVCVVCGVCEHVCVVCGVCEHVGVACMSMCVSVVWECVSM